MEKEIKIMLAEKLKNTIEVVIKNTEQISNLLSLLEILQEKILRLEGKSISNIYKVTKEDIDSSELTNKDVLNQLPNL